jgi:hypothetical protein
MITPGDLFMERDAARPKIFQIQDDAHRTGWYRVQHHLTAHELDVELSNLGWTFFFMANVIRKSALAFDPEKGASSALKRVMASVRADGCNSLQMQAVETHSFLGIPYIRVSAHPRHLQRSGVFSRHLQPNSVSTVIDTPVAGDGPVTEYGHRRSR